MNESLARSLLLLGAVYAAAGGAFALAFAWRLVDRLDPAARGAGWGFRLLVLPGAALLWPYLLARTLRGATAPPVEHNAHDRAAAAPHAGLGASR